jgi:hypothetical protein
VYGLLESPVHLGAGGGRGGHNYAPGRGGNGGGRVTIEAGVLQVDGAIRADGATVPIDDSFYYQPGAGAGGSILIRAGTVTGTGRITAAGGGNGRDVWNSYGGSGGGGRVAVYYDALSFPADSITARGGVAVNVPGVGGSAGTVYLKANAEPYGSVIIDNGSNACGLFTPWRSALAAVRALTVRAEARLEVTADVAVEGPLTVDSNGTIGRP